MLLALTLACCAPQAPLDVARANEARRVAVVERCAPAVASVMAMDAPGGGSGVVIDPRGFVLTNYHVVGEPDQGYTPPDAPSPPADDVEAFQRANPAAGDAELDAFCKRWQDEWRAEHRGKGARHWKKKKVGLPDGQLYEAVVLGIDPGSDLAVLRLLPRAPGQTWPHCELGDSDALLVGETVFAMGNPFLLATDFTPTVTFGIVSGTHRYQPGAGQRMLVYPDCIQVDAPVNPGNSGGPLFNEAGEVVGINGRISIGDRGRVNVGVGFAIASNQIRNFLCDLLAGRHAEHGTLDMSAWFMTARADENKRRGVFVQQMFKDSVAAAAGVGLGDEILRFDGTDVRSANQLATLVGVLPKGAWVTLVHRPSLGEAGFGPEREVTVRLAALDTGSSFDGTGEDARLASRADRRLATEAVMRNWRRGRSVHDTMAWSRQAPDGSTHRTIASRDALRIELPGLVLVRTADGGGFAREGERTRDLTADESERLRREAACNPLPWPRQRIRERLASANALLVGGVHVLGAPAARLRLDGDGECEAWFFADGTPAGFTFRDPLRRAKVEWHVRGEQLRVVVDGKLEPGWTASAIEGLPSSTSGVGPDPESLFRRDR
jgi:S1-C subfamily serine protease